jgi:hypothetical protein
MENNMDKYKCTVCGYIYDPEAGDPDGGIAPNTPFDKLPTVGSALFVAHQKMILKIL